MRNFGIGVLFRNKLVKCLCHPSGLWSINNILIIIVAVSFLGG